MIEIEVTNVLVRYLISGIDVRVINLLHEEEGKCYTLKISGENETASSGKGDYIVQWPLDDSTCQV